MSLLAATHCLGSIEQVECFLGGPLIFTTFACAVLFIFSCVPVKLKALTKSPLTSSNLPISTLSVHLSRLRVGQQFIAQFLYDNVEATR